MKSFKPLLFSIFLVGLLSLQSANAQEFNLASGNAALGVVVPAAGPVASQEWGRGDATLIFRLTSLLGNAWFDAIAPYHSTAVGVHSDLGRRPAAESADTEARNIALLYASYRILNSLLPHRAPDWRRMLSSVGLNPENGERNTETPAGIGNMAGDAVAAFSLRDGMNQLGDEGGCVYNCVPYSDYTGYAPVNTAYRLRDPSKWQPYIVTGGNGIFRVQQFVTAQYGVAVPYSFDGPSQFFVPPPQASNHRTNPGDYRAQADEVLARSAALTDELKMRAQLFDNKFRAFGGATTFAAAQNNLTLNNFVNYYFLINLAGRDVGIVVWHWKKQYDAVRPYSAIPYLYGDDPVTAWGGPGQGTVTDLPASEWKHYLPVADHPEYPSASATFCAAVAQASRNFFGSDDYNWNPDFDAGSSIIEPGLVPATDITLSFPTWTAYEEACGQARVDGGVHFPASIQYSPQMGHPVGDLVYNLIQDHLAGNHEPKFYPVP